MKFATISTSILKILLFSSIANAQIPCIVTKSEPEEVRVRCEVGDQIIEQGSLEKNGKRFLSERKRRWHGFKTWQEVEVPELPDELPPIEVEVPRDFVEPIALDIPEVALDTPVIHDVGIFYTPKAETAQGGYAAMQSLCAQSVAVANQTYVNSQIPLTLVLKTCQKVDYVEQPTAISSDLSRIRNVTDGFMDQVHSIRNNLKIDIVTLIGSGYASNGNCGVGYFMSSLSSFWESQAFNVVDRTCAVGRPSYGHELGHNQGLHHNPENACSAPTCNGYHYGHHACGFGTMMSYLGSRQRYISNPLVSLNGCPTGIAGQRDNARRLKESMLIVSNFRVSTVERLQKPKGDRVK